jgi:NAD(P)-dependent dehydrogenase (short-subunit alcohol dehydrogenase family)
VTGASSGIGRACALRFAEDGHRVVAIARGLDALNTLRDEAGPSILPWAFDLAGPSPDALVAPLVAAHGAPSVVVHAAGMLRGGPLESVDLDAFDQTMNLNVRALYAINRALWPHLRPQGASAAVVHISSVAGPRPYANLAAYCVSKAAVDALTRCLALEWAPDGVRVNAVNPGVVVTELHRRGGMSEESYQRFLERSRETHPLGRVGTPEEVAAAVAWLAGPDAGWITGETLAIDGGRHLTSLR